MQGMQLHHVAKLFWTKFIRFEQNDDEIGAKLKRDLGKSD